MWSKRTEKKKKWMYTQGAEWHGDTKLYILDRQSKAWYIKKTLAKVSSPALIFHLHYQRSILIMVGKATKMVFIKLILFIILGLSWGIKHKQAYTWTKKQNGNCLQSYISNVIVLTFVKYINTQNIKNINQNLAGHAVTLWG